MRRLLVLFVSIMIVLTLAACGSNSNSQGSSKVVEPQATTPEEGSSTPELQVTTPEKSSTPEPQATTPEEGPSTPEPQVTTPEKSSTPELQVTTPEKNSTPAQVTNPPISASPDEVQKDSRTPHILIAYFSHSGHTRTLAEQIHENVESDLFEIVTINPYPDDYDTLLDLATKEQHENARPELATHVENMAAYDVIFIGYPIWWGTMPMAVFTFIVPFCTHEGSGLGSSVSDLAKLWPEATLLNGLAIQGPSANSAQEQVTSWLRGVP